MKKQLLPISISLSLFGVFSVLTYILMRWLNIFSVSHKFDITFFFIEFCIGVFIYLKTAVDYSIFVGLLMENNQGIPKRIAMNAGTQIGCFIGVTAIVVLWYFFKEIHWLMAILLVTAAMVLFKLASSAEEHYDEVDERLKKPLQIFLSFLNPVIRLFTFFMPEGNLGDQELNVWPLFILSMIIPFALGADDLAGYMTLLSPVNAFSLLLGIYFGDAIIDIALFANPALTIQTVKNKWISYFGALFFVGLGILSIIDAVKLFF